MSLPSPNADSTAQVTIYRDSIAPAQSYDDKVLAVLREYADKRLGSKTPLVCYVDQRDWLTKDGTNWGSAVVVADLADLAPSPSRLTMLDRLLSKGVRVHVASLGGEVNQHAHLILACARAWSNLEPQIATLRKSLADQAADAARREVQIASELTGNLVQVGIVSAVRDCVKAAYPGATANA